MFKAIIFLGQFSQYYSQLPLSIRNFIDVFVSLFLATLITWAILHLIRRIFKSRFKPYLVDTFKIQSVSRLETISELLQNCLLYLVYFVYFYFVLSKLGVPIGTLIAGAGIFGIAIGLGAKDLITDIINGFFIIFEGQFQVGDLVSLPNLDVSGTILGIGLRTTRIKSLSGETYFIPNSDISLVNNMSRLHRNIIIEIPLNLQIKLQNFEKTIDLVNEKITNNYSNVLIQKPNNIGIIKNSDGRFHYRVTITVKNSAYYHHTSIFYREYFDSLQEIGYQFPEFNYLSR